jgi:hypothetical protein
MTGNSLISREKHVTPMSLTFAVDASSLALVQPVSGCFGVFRGVSGCFGVFRGVSGCFGVLSEQTSARESGGALPCSWAEYEGSFSVVHRDVESLRSGQRSDDDQHDLGAHGWTAEPTPECFGNRR